MMGTGVGLTIGFIFGSWSIIRYVVRFFVDSQPHQRVTLGRGGAGPRGAMATLSQYMLSSAATFGFFLAIGSVSMTARSAHPNTTDSIRFRLFAVILPCFLLTWRLPISS